jgi:bifunctional non-homologous end joining protein LigD
VNALEVRNREKIFWPASGFTKGDVVDYYVRVAPVLLPHLRDRPVTLRRFPDGVDGVNWYQLNCRGPAWVRTQRERAFDLCVLDDVRALVWAADVGTIEIHPFLHRAGCDRADAIVFDLDPGPDADISDCCTVALLIRDRLGGVAKTSGSLGVHVYVPTDLAYDRTKACARRVAEELERERPDLVVSRQRRELRAGRVLIDWLQNDPTRQTVAPYSLRGLAYPTVSTPVTWDEVERCARERRPELLTYLPTDVLERVLHVGDLFADAGLTRT